MFNTISFIIVAVIFGIVLYYGVEAMDKEAEARRARHERFVQQMDGETRNIISGGGK